MKKQTVLRVSVFLAAVVMLCAMLCACGRTNTDDTANDARLGMDTGRTTNYRYDRDDDILDYDLDTDMDILDDDIREGVDDVFGRKKTDGGAMDGTPDGADTYGATYDTNLDDSMDNTKATANHR